MSASFFRRAVIALVMALSASAASASDVQIPIDDEFTFGEIMGDGGVGPVYAYAVAPRAIDGRIFFCGAFQPLGPGAFGQIRAYQSRSELFLGGKPVLRDFTYFARVDPFNVLRQSFANCRATPVQGTTAPEFEIKGPTLKYRG